MGIRILVPRPRPRERLARTHRFLWVALCVAIWGVTYTLFGSGGLVGVYRSQADVDRLQREVARAEATNLDLEERIEALRSDPDTIERYARESFFMARPGDTVYLLPRSRAEDGREAAAATPPGEVPRELQRP